jgi:prevent-host-death family protein
LLLFLFCGVIQLKLVGMTRKSSSKARKQSTASPASAEPQQAARKVASGQWVLQDAKARFSELVRQVKSDGPQVVTIHGREEVVVVSVAEFRRLQGAVSGQALIDALQASPHRDVEIMPERLSAPVRDVEL